MNKKEFMQKLKDSLMGLNQNDKREVLLDYEEHFLDGKNQGRTEEEICEALGDPREIANEIKNQSQKSAPSTDGVNTAGYIIGIIILAVACFALGSVLLSVIAGAISGIFGAVAVAAVFSNAMLRLTAISAIVLIIAIFVLIALGIIKLIPLVVKWFKQLAMSLDGKTEEAKKVEHKKIKIHPVVWILTVLLCIASISGVIIGSVGFAKEAVKDFDAEDIHDIQSFITNIAYDHGNWVYFSESDSEEFERSMEDFADDMEEFADDMEDHFDNNRFWFFGWRYIFGD
ncbi:MAG: DUF1700 domain-containing protein [Clostridia bacterium]|nr:DUF1700 domain-containing protein [Clostridia bacterium]